MRCSNCPVAHDATCLGESASHVYMCQFASTGDPLQRKHVVERSALVDAPQAPSLPAQAVSFAKAVAKHVATGRHRVSTERQAARLAICHACEFHQNERCLKCGCTDKGLGVKTGWAEQSCPLDPPKWGPVT